MSQAIDHKDIIIIGGGLAGLTLANILKNHDIPFLVIENGVRPDTPNLTSARTAALMMPSINVLKAANIWDRIIDQSEQLKTLRIIDDSAQDKSKMVTLDFEASDINLDAFGYNISNDILRFELINALEKEDILFEAHIEEFEENVIALNNGRTLKANLIVAADGRNSATREAFGIDITQKHYDQTAITCKISHSLDHQNISTELHRSGGPCTFVPLPDANQSSVVWVEDTQDANEILKLPKDAFIKKLQERSQDILGKIEFLTPSQSWPLCSIRADKLTAKRLVLIAEAAHVLSPIGAQGLNLSMRDVAVLAELIIDTVSVGGDVGSEALLSRYEARRQKDISKRAFAVGSLNELVHTNNPIIHMARKTGLRFAGSIPILKKAIMKEGLTAWDVECRFLNDAA